jgi:hypothetical protein
MNAPAFYSGDPIRDAEHHYHRKTLHEDACDARAAYILATPDELEYVVQNQQPEIWRYLVDLIDAVNRCELKHPYAESRLLQAATGLRNMLTACADAEVDTYLPDEGE